MTEKLDWSKLSEMPPHAPTGKGWYQLANGFIGYVQGPDPNNSPWKIRLCEGHAMFYRKDGTLFSNSIFGSCEDWRIVKYLGDVLPWEECERLKDEINHWKVKVECYGDMVHGCHPIFVKLGVLEENQKGVGAIANAAQELATINKQLEAERDELQNQIVEMLGDYKTLKAKHDVLDAGMRAASIVTLLEREKELTGYIETLQDRVVQSLSQISDLQQRVAKLEQMQASPPMDCVANSTAFVTHDPESVHQAPDTEEVPTFKVGDVVYNKKAMWTGKVDKVSRSIKILISGDSHWRDENDFRHATPAERVQAEKEVE